MAIKSKKLLSYRSIIDNGIDIYFTNIYPAPQNHQLHERAWFYYRGAVEDLTTALEYPRALKLSNPLMSGT